MSAESLGLICATVLPSTLMRTGVTDRLTLNDCKMESYIVHCRTSTDVDGRTNGRKDRDRGQIGVSKSPSTCGCTIGPPADNEYAVEPVGVATRTLNFMFGRKSIL